MEQVKHEQLAKLLTIKNKTYIAINSKIYDLLQDTLIEAISLLINSPKEGFSEFDAYYKDDVLVAYLQNTIDEQIYSVKIGIPIDMVFNPPEDILQFMKNQMDEYKEEYNIDEAIIPEQTIPFDTSQLTEQQKQQLKFATKSDKRH